MSNRHDEVVKAFGQEWETFDQSDVSLSELERIFGDYFRIFPWEKLPRDAVGFDLGCGSGRWARFVAARVGKVHCVDASEQAIAVARQNLKTSSNVLFHCASVDQLPFADQTMDFGYSLGVLHHVPDTAAGIASCVRKLKRGAPFLVYLYYAFDNKPWWFRVIWKLSDVMRQAICLLPFALKRLVCEIAAATIYWPLARLAQLLEFMGCKVGSLPLSAYRKSSFYIMRNDALDRFGTKLEQRFTRQEIATMLETAGLRDVQFNSREPYWCAVGVKI